METLEYRDRFIQSLHEKAIRKLEKLSIVKQNKSFYVLLKIENLSEIKLPYTIQLVAFDKLVSDTNTKIEKTSLPISGPINKSFFLKHKLWKQLQIYGIIENDILKVTSSMGDIVVHCQAR